MRNITQTSAFRWIVVVNLLIFIFSALIGFLVVDSGYTAFGGITVESWNAFWYAFRDSLIIFYAIILITSVVVGSCIWASKGK